MSGTTDEDLPWTDGMNPAIVGGGERRIGESSKATGAGLQQNGAVIRATGGRSWTSVSARRAGAGG